ncbi:MAG: hypothetical protein KC910_30890, partial [Candidatus Eremiobacteraeota bacterium]|nr:hypothetical protein [Candidatus Eremiobacteraeota bacterium]
MSEINRISGIGGNRALGGANYVSQGAPTQSTAPAAQTAPASPSDGVSISAASQEDDAGSTN